MAAPLAAQLGVDPRRTIAAPGPLVLSLDENGQLRILAVPVTGLALAGSVAGGTGDLQHPIVVGYTAEDYPGGAVAVDDLSLEVPDRKIVILAGPSGCGKTTTLRMVDRPVEPTGGRILLDGHDVAQGRPAALRRGIGYVIQQTGLFTHRTAEDNIATVPVLDGWRRGRAWPVSRHRRQLGRGIRRLRDRGPESQAVRAKAPRRRPERGTRNPAAAKAGAVRSAWEASRKRHVIRRCQVRRCAASRQGNHHPAWDGRWVGSRSADALRRSPV
jgi:hypothetical protein